MFATTDLLVGVDVHRRTNVVQVMDGAGRGAAPRLRVANNRSGTAHLVSQLAELATAGDFDAHPHRRRSHRQLLAALLLRTGTVADLG